MNNGVGNDLVSGFVGFFVFFFFFQIVDSVFVELFNC